MKHPKHCLPLNRNWISWLQISRRTHRLRIGKTTNQSVCDLLIVHLLQKFCFAPVFFFHKLTGAPSESGAQQVHGIKKFE